VIDVKRQPSEGRLNCKLTTEPEHFPGMDAVVLSASKKCVVSMFLSL
jgi:hypothetical protein